MSRLTIKDKAIRDNFNAEYAKLADLEDIEEKHSVLSLDDLDNRLSALEIIKEHKLLNYVLKNKKCANMYHLSKEECDLLKEALK